MIFTRDFWQKDLRPPILPKAEDEEGSLVTRSLAQTTYDRMRSDVIFGRLAPSARLRLEDLRQQYGVSIPTLREVLNRLAADGFVVAEEQRGFSVAPISAENLKELASLRMLIEMDALARSLRAGDVAWESHVVAVHHKLARTEARMMAGDTSVLDQWKRYDSEFHNALIRACGSDELLAVHSQVFDKYLRYQMLYLTFRGAISGEEHRGMMEAALERDVPTAQAILERHISAGVIHALSAHEDRNGS